MSLLTLMQIEQEVAARLGPYRNELAASGTASTITCAALTSTIEQGGLTDLSLLRRGFTYGGADISGFVTGDRQRMVKDWMPNTGTLLVDRTYTNPVIANEMIELHHLDPANQLRPAVQRGLWRCFYVDPGELATSEAATERDVTAVLPWITQPEQIYRVEWNFPNALTPPAPVGWFETFLRDRKVWLQVWPDVYPNTLVIRARRAVATRTSSTRTWTWTTPRRPDISKRGEGRGGVSRWRRRKGSIQAKKKPRMSFRANRRCISRHHPRSSSTPIRSPCGRWESSRGHVIDETPVSIQPRDRRQGRDAAAHARGADGRTQGPEPRQRGTG